MFAIEHTARRAAALSLATLLAACAPDAEPTRAATPTDAIVAATRVGTAADRAAVEASLTDAITRIAPTLGGGAPGIPLTHALDDVRAALEIGDAQPLGDAIARARRVLDTQVPAGPAADPSRAADAAVVRLALDRAASLPR